MTWNGVPNIPDNLKLNFPLAIFHAIGYNFNVACLLSVMDIT